MTPAATRPCGRICAGRDAAGQGGPVEARCTTAKNIAALIDEIGLALPIIEAKQKTITAPLKELAPYTEKMKTLTALVRAIKRHDPDETFELRRSTGRAMFLAIRDTGPGVPRGNVERRRGRSAVSGVAYRHRHRPMRRRPSRCPLSRTTF
jgi:hypothetical protein